MEHAEFDLRMRERGWVLFPGVVPAALLVRLKDDLEDKLAECQAWQERNGLAPDAQGSAHHILGGDTSLDEFLAALYLDEYVERYFGGPYILNTFGASVNVTGNEGSYLHRMHRDVRSHTGGYRLLLNMLVMLDAFTEENGATYLLSMSHRVPERPTEEAFKRSAERLVGPAGSIALFDSNLWHAAGANQTGAARAALTLVFSRPFVKQQMDYPRFVGQAYIARSPERLKRILGYYARTPASYDEWYQPPHRRLYRADQG